MGYELKNANISYISLVTKGANGRQFAIMKSATTKQPNISKQVPILKTEEEKQLVTGVVYEPDVEDSHGDTMTAEEIEKAAYTLWKITNTSISNMMKLLVKEQLLKTGLLKVI